MVNKKDKISKIMWIILGISIVLIILSILMSFNIVNIAKLNYNLKADSYSKDKEVLRVVNICQNNLTKSKCVFDNFPFVWTARGSMNLTNDTWIMSPTELKENKYEGLCRDIATARLEMFKKLGVTVELIFVPDHVYIKTYENGTIYELNNQLLYYYPEDGRMKIESP